MNGHPDFLCIGAPKCGSTWLHQLLQSHPQVFLPDQIKEVHFFDRHFRRGVNWYHDLFQGSLPGQVCGECTPHYLYLPDPAIIKDVPSIRKFILILRDPVERLISHYRFRQRLDAYQGNLDQFLEDYPAAIESSRYGQGLQRFLDVFEPHQFLVLDFESAVRDYRTTRAQLAEFLTIDPEQFPVDAGKDEINANFVPRYRRLYRYATRASRWLADRGLYRVRNRLKVLLAGTLEKRARSRGQQHVQLDEARRAQLQQLFAKDQERLAVLTARIQSAKSVHST